MSDTLKFRWNGTLYAGRILGKQNGRTLIEAIDHGPRFAPGTQIEVEDSQIIPQPEVTHSAQSNGSVSALDGPSAPPVSAGDAGALQKAMDEERKSLPSVAEVIADPNPTPPLSASGSAAANRKDEPMSESTALSRIQEKAKQAASATAEVAAAVENTLDDILARKQALLQRNTDLHAQHTQIINQANAGLDIMDAALRQLSNGAPA